MIRFFLNQVITLHVCVEELVVYVKTELQKRGFISRDLTSLPLDMTSGSRELLLALGWLLCKEDIVARFMKTCTSPLEEEDTAYIYAQVCQYYIPPMREVLSIGI